MTAVSFLLGGCLFRDARGFQGQECMACSGPRTLDFVMKLVYCMTACVHMDVVIWGGIHIRADIAFDKLSCLT